ncbi:hypothetical protein PILCRDRAFT_99232 [Piloderma croceum F 1598]|uniref:Uncharacterized protein n=1 Tax=Piloderma croceum (strain F 1598) TaxID=765440 RepID=A0A0C3B958_PILCF|nr:hypothetical protein PILCRDRAFT_99232 [Piloderma croceum F 1598]
MMECPPPNPTTTVEEEESDDEEEEEIAEDGEPEPWPQPTFVAGQYTPPPTVATAAFALADLNRVLRPSRDLGGGHKDPKLDSLLCRHLERMQMFLRNYTDPTNKAPRWQAASLKMLLLHLQGIGKYVRAMDIVEYVGTPEVLVCLKLTKMISLATAQCWMKTVGYCWSKTPTGQFVDGHEWVDVVEYRQVVFLPVWVELLSWTRIYTTDGNECLVPPPITRCVVIWNHDESTYYANNRRKIQWVHKTENAVPYAKGEGASMMITDMVSPDYGWLQSPDGKEKVHVVFKAGKNQQGYFMNGDILKQASSTMDILECHYPDEDHIMVIDNASTHLKRVDDALSATHMPKFSPKLGKEWDGTDWGEGWQPKNWGVEVNVVGEDRKQVYQPNGMALKQKVKMCNGTFANGSPQSLYYPDGHDLVGQEQGYVGALKIRAECPKFHCKKGAIQCCCQRMLYNEPDFVTVELLLEIACKAWGFHAIFFPKFHCKLNFIEQCWGYSKRIYRQCPVSSKEANLECNVLASLESIPLKCIRQGLNGKQAAWVSKQYCGHCVLPESIMRDLTTAGIN